MWFLHIYLLKALLLFMNSRLDPLDIITVALAKNVYIYEYSNLHFSLRMGKVYLKINIYIEL
jgi:hypothetical protein